MYVMYVIEMEGIIFIIYLFFIYYTSRRTCTFPGFACVHIPRRYIVHIHDIHTTCIQLTTKLTYLRYIGIYLYTWSGIDFIPKVM